MGKAVFFCNLGDLTIGVQFYFSLLCLKKARIAKPSSIQATRAVEILCQSGYYAVAKRAAIALTRSMEYLAILAIKS